MQMAVWIAVEYVGEIIAVARCSSKRSIAGIMVERFDTVDLE